MEKKEYPVLKNFMVVCDHNGEYHIWTKHGYESYIAGAVEVGGGSAYRIVIAFDGDESYLRDAQPLPASLEQAAEAAAKEKFTIPEFISAYKPGFFDGANHILNSIVAEKDKEIAYLKEQNKKSSESFAALVDVLNSVETKKSELLETIKQKEQEIERLKKLIHGLHSTIWIDYSSDRSQFQWEKYKTENNL